MKKRHSASLTLSVLLALSACGPSPQSEEDEVFQDTESYTDDSYEARRGTLTLEVLISQAHDKTLGEGTQTSRFVTTYDLSARLEQAVYLPDDLRYFLKPAGDPNTEDRSDYFDNGPYWPINGEDPEFSGTLVYDGTEKFENPSDLHFILLENRNVGRAELHRIGLNNLEPSRFGEGMEFSLDWMFKGREKRFERSLAKDGTETLDSNVNDEKITRAEDLDFFPPLTATRLADYPYEFEYNAVPDLIQTYRDTDQALLDALQAQARGDHDIQKFFGTVTKASKDEMTIHYADSARLLNLNYLHSIPLKPNIKSDIEVTIRIEAEKK